MFSCFKTKTISEEVLDDFQVYELTEQLEASDSKNKKLRIEIDELKATIDKLESDLIEQKSNEELDDCWIDFVELNAMVIERRPSERSTCIMYMVNGLTRNMYIKCSLNTHYRLVEEFKRVTK